MVTDGPRGTAESFILVQQIHSRGLQGPRAWRCAVQGGAGELQGGRSAGSESAMCLLQQLYSPRPTLCTTTHTGTSPIEKWSPIYLKNVKGSILPIHPCVVNYISRLLKFTIYNDIL